MQPNEVKPGHRYRRRQLGSLAATATVLDLRSDLVGIPHVQFSVHGRWVDNEAVGRRHSGVGPPIFPRYLSRAPRAGSPTRCDQHRRCNSGPTIAETSSSLILSVWHPVHACGVGFGTTSVAACIRATI